MMSNQDNINGLDQSALLAALSADRQNRSKQKGSILVIDQFWERTSPAKPGRMNDVTIVCPNCSCKIFRPNAAAFRDMKQEQSDSTLGSVPEIKALEKFTSDQSESKGLWIVSNMMAFENIGFSKPVPGEKASHPRAQRYLCCADCDLGPLGYQAGPKEFVIVASRVGYNL